MLDFNSITRTPPSEASREVILRQLLRRLRRIQKETLVYRGKRTWCFRCRRSIEDGDPYRVEVFYLGDDPVETKTHQLTCSQYRNRPVLEASEARVTLIPRGHIQELVMTDEQETQEQEQEEAPRKRRKSRKTKTRSKAKSRKSSSKDSTKTSKTKSKSKGKKSRKAKGDGEGRSAAASAAEALTKVEAFNTRKVSKTLKAMKAGETPSNEDLTTLREHVKAEAARLREEDDGSSASELSSANRLVRRLERATR